MKTNKLISIRANPILATGVFVGLSILNVELQAGVFFTKALDEDGEVLRFKGEENLNGFSEWMVQWNECSSGVGKISGQVTWDYAAARTEVSWPTDSKLLVGCASRTMSEKLNIFFNDNFAYCAAFASTPAARQEISKSVSRVDDKSDCSGVDNIIVAAVGRAERELKSEIEASVRDVSRIEILHQGILADENHSSTSYHSKPTMRAIDISHIRLRTNGGFVKTYQHNVGTYAENLDIAKKSSLKTISQLVQQRFWRAFGACMTSKGGAVISKTLHHSGAGLRHAGHMHVSLPFKNKGNYNSKSVTPKPAVTF